MELDSLTKNAQDLLKLNYFYKTDATNCPNAPAGNNGQIQCILDASNQTLTAGAAGRSVTYTYDALYRLKTAATSGSTQFPAWGLQWTYDRYGNRTNQSQTAGSPPTNSMTISTTTNRITETWASYDSNGNMTNDGLNAMTYNAENRTVTSTGAEYVYDGAGIRVRRCLPNCTSPTSRTVYVFSGSKVIAEYDNGAAVGSPTREYIYLGGQLLAKFEAGATTYVHHDHLSARVMTNPSGGIVAQSAHFPFGESWYESGGSNKLKFTSYERDSESGNDYAIFRYHIARFGRFSSPDPIAGSIGNPQSLNRFSYVASDPINLIDPMGLAMEQSCWHAACGGSDTVFIGGAPATRGQVDFFQRNGFGGILPEAVPEWGWDQNGLFHSQYQNRGHGWGFYGYWFESGEVHFEDRPQHRAGNQQPEPPWSDVIKALLDKIKEIAKGKPECAQLLGGSERVNSNLNGATVYPPDTFSPNIRGSVEAYEILKDNEWGAVHFDHNIFLGAKFRNHPTAAQLTILIHEFRHHIYGRMGEPPLTNRKAYNKYLSKEIQTIVSACGTGVPKAKKR